MKRNYFRWMTIALTLGHALVSQAATVSDLETVSKPRLEIGIASGFPTVVGIELGVWGPSAVPLVARATLGMGTQLDLGIHLPAGSNPSHRLFVAATGGVFGYFGIKANPLFNVGPTVGARIGSFFAQGGPCMYFNGRDSQFAVQGQVGVSFLY